MSVMKKRLENNSYCISNKVIYTDFKDIQIVVLFEWLLLNAVVDFSMRHSLSAGDPGSIFLRCALLGFPLLRASSMQESYVPAQINNQQLSLTSPFLIKM